MPSIYQLKSLFSDVLRPVTNALAVHGVTANQVTVSAMVVSVVLALVLYLGTYLFSLSPILWLLMPVWMFIRMALNNIDGMLACEHNMATPAGAILNEMGDVVSDSVLFLCFAVLPGINIPLLASLTLLAVMSEMMGVVAVQIGASRRYDGPSGKSDRALFFSIMALVYAMGIPLAGWATWALVLINCLLVITLFNRANMALKEIRT